MKIKMEKGKLENKRKRKISNQLQDMDDKETENRKLEKNELEGKTSNSKSNEGQQEEMASASFRPICFNNVCLPSTGGDVQGLYKDSSLKILCP